MFNNITERLTLSIKRYRSDLNESEIETIKFGLECLISELSKFVTYFFIFMMLSMTMEYIVAFLFLCIPRLFAGGYHSKTYWGCFFVTFIAFCLAVFIGRMFYFGFIWRAFIMVFSFTLTIFYAPVDHLNKPIISEKRRKLFKFYSAFCMMIMGSIVLFYNHRLAMVATIALFVQALSLPVGFYLNKRSEML